jgi:4-diphosphocytidyl-2-C-methyl-D-erythritol kinase
VNKIKLKARAKINLTLELLDKREDNYHNLKSVFQRVNLYDTLYIYKTKNGVLELETDNEEINNNKNIICKAYNRLKDMYDIGGVKVVLKKRIPMQAGLGGGSADCASFILGVNQLFNLNMSEEEMVSLGSSLGADVVPCLYDGALLAEGIGNVITLINTNFKYYILIIKPDLSCNTKEMFELLDREDGNLSISNSDDVVYALLENDIDLLSNNLYNSFEEVLDLSHYKYELMLNRAKGALLTGSGSCVYGIFKNRYDAIRAYMYLRKKFL